jgi:hypothetical protein
LKPLLATVVPYTFIKRNVYPYNYRPKILLFGKSPFGLQDLRSSRSNVGTQELIRN